MESNQTAETGDSTDTSKTPHGDTSGNPKDTDLLNAQHRMFENISLSKARIKNQQRNEEDLSTSERIKILKEQFDQTPGVFIERFHPYLCEDDLQCFDSVSDVYEVSFYLKEVRKRLSAGQHPVLVKNRRYEALKKLEKEGTYFSDDEMWARDPLMYEQLIGQYLTDEERLETRTKIDKTDLKFSTILMSFMQDQETKALYKRQQEREEGAEEEEEEEEEEEGGEEEEAGARNTGQSRDRERRLQEPVRRGVDEDTEGEDEDETMDEEEEGGGAVRQRQPTPATDAEKRLLREEFQNLMRERFLGGGDEHFDYGAVDNNADYDSLAIRGWDEEEKYFDDEDAEGGCRIDAQRARDESSMFKVSRTLHDEELDDYEKWTPDETPME